MYKCDKDKTSQFKVKTKADIEENKGNMKLNCLIIEKIEIILF